MYAKVYAQIFDSSLRDKWQAWVVFVAMLALADADDELDMTLEALAARTGLPGSIVSEGVAWLEKPDPFSRSPEAEGRRIVRLDDHRAWGWKIVNRAKYKRLRDNTERREYFRVQKQAKRADVHHSPPVSTFVHQCPPQAVCSMQLGIESEPLPKSERPKKQPKEDPEGFQRFWDAYKNSFGRRTEKPAAAAEWKRQRCEDIADQVLQALERYKQTREWAEGFMPYPARWLKRRLWDDDSAVDAEVDPLWDGPRVRS